MAAAALATAITVLLVPSAATTATPEPSPAELREMRFKLADAIADEKRALELLTKVPPRFHTAELMLRRSRTSLFQLAGALSGSTKNALENAGNADQTVIDRIPEGKKGWRSEYDREVAMDWLEYAFQRKSVAMSLLSQPAAAQGAQCGDRIDNDGDGTVDARHDSGCASTKDATERSALTCSLGYTANTPVSVVQGTCSGPFAKLELTAPVGVAFDPASMPVVQYARACRYASERRLECVMSDGVANPRHVVRARFKFRRHSTSRPRVLIRDFRGAARTWPVAPAQAPSAAPYLRFNLSYTHDGPSHVCVSVEAASGALLKLSLEGPNGQAVSGTLQLKKKATKTAPGGFSFRILALGTYRVTVSATVGGKSVTKTGTIAVTEARGDSRCSATSAPPP